MTQITISHKEKPGLLQGLLFGCVPAKLHFVFQRRLKTMQLWGDGIHLCSTLYSQLFELYRCNLLWHIFFPVQCQHFFFLYNIRNLALP